MKRLLGAVLAVAFMGATVAVPAALAGTVDSFAGQKEKAAAEKPKKLSTTGTVTAVSGNSLAIKTGSGEMTFTVDSTTKAMGTGMGTKAREQAAAGKATLITDFVSVGDLVRVDYHEAGATKHAAEVHVTRKALK